MIYENMISQMISAKGRKLYFYTRYSEEKHRNDIEIDFLLSNESKTNHRVFPIEVKSSAIKNHKSIDNFEMKYSKYVGERYLLSQKDVGKIGTLKLKPIYMILFLLKDL